MGFEVTKPVTGWKTLGITLIDTGTVEGWELAEKLRDCIDGLPSSELVTIGFNDSERVSIDSLIGTEWRQ